MKPSTLAVAILLSVTPAALSLAPTAPPATPEAILDLAALEGLPVADARAGLAFARAAGPDDPAGVLALAAELVASRDPALTATARLAQAQVAAALRARDAGDPTSVALALLAAQPRPAHRASLPEMATHDTLAGAMAAFHASVGVPFTEDDAAWFARVDADAPSTSLALARIVDAHVFQRAAAILAFQTSPPDHGMLVAARDEVARIVVSSIPDLDAPGLGRRSMTNVYSLDLGNASAPTNDTTYARDMLLIVDLDGNDTYLNNAGASTNAWVLEADARTPSLQPPSCGGGTVQVLICRVEATATCYGTGQCEIPSRPPCLTASPIDDDPYLRCNIAALVVDTRGDDRYVGEADVWPVEPAFNGAGSHGIGVLVDVRGDDVYQPRVRPSAAFPGSETSSTMNGAGDTGAGLLLDLSGDDVYDARAGRGAFNGGGYTGHGALIDVRGDDRYLARTNRTGALNGAGFLGVGSLADLSGNDTYHATTGANAPWSYLGTVNGGGYAGLGVLVDLAGDDAYWGDVGSGGGGANGGALRGVGILLDDGGSDVYDGRVLVGGGINGGSLLGVGVLVDTIGDNTFLGTPPAAGGANGGAGGTVVVGGVRNLTEDLAGALPAAIPPGLAGLIPDGAHSPGGIGILLAGGGNDTYRSTGTTQGAGDLSGIGILVDAGGRNVYDAGPGGLAQGAGARTGIGIILDHGASADMTIRAGTIGQGSGVQGTGLLLLTDPEGAGIFTSLAGLASVSEGAGAGLRFLAGTIDLLGDIPDFACRADGDLVAPLAGINVCRPSSAHSQTFANPLDGQPLLGGSVTNPHPVACDDVLALVPTEPTCEDTYVEELGVARFQAGTYPVTQEEQFRLSSSGGVVAIHSMATFFVRGRIESYSADDWCNPGC